MVACSDRPGLERVLEEEIPRLMEMAEVPGLSMAVIQGGEIFWTGAFGVRNAETGDPLDTETIFEAASLTKTVTAACALKLVEDGELDLDTPLAEFLPYPKLAGDERYKKITPRMVLTHTTGLPNWGNRLIRKPGEVYGYSGEGFLYLGRTIEKIIGKSLQDFAWEIIFEPLGMTHTSYVWNEAYAANGAQGHDRYGSVHALRKNTTPNGGASLLTTPTDYARYLCALMNGEVLKLETVNRMLSPQVKATVWDTTEPDEHISWGWGWGIQPGDTENGFWHWGNNGDLRGYAVAYRERKEGLVFFVNSENGFALAEPLVALVTDEPQYAMQWLNWERYRFDNPRVKAQRSMEKAFLDGGAETGLAKLDEIKDQYPDLYEAASLERTAGFLVERGKMVEAAALFGRMVELEPKRVQAWEGLGLAEMERERFTEAIHAFEKALAINPQRRMAKNGIPWVKELMAAKGKTVEVPLPVLESYAGNYGPRRVFLREGYLYYQRGGRPEIRLLPLSRDTFLLEGSLRFRLRFVTDSTGKVTKVKGLYIEGRMDESSRTG
jgi:CubicO group peptidase (beta-lactamase class C family)